MLTLRAKSRLEKLIQIRSFRRGESALESRLIKLSWLKEKTLCSPTLRNLISASLILIDLMLETLYNCFQNRLSIVLTLTSSNGMSSPTASIKSLRKSLVCLRTSNRHLVEISLRCTSLWEPHIWTKKRCRQRADSSYSESTKKIAESISCTRWRSLVASKRLQLFERTTSS